MDTVLLQAVLSVFQDGGWHTIRDVFYQAGREKHTRENRSELVRWIREHTVVNGEDRRTHFRAKHPRGVPNGKQATYHLSSEGFQRLNHFLHQKRRILLAGGDQSKLISFLSLNPGKSFSSADISSLVFKGKANAHRITTLIRQLRQKGYIIEAEADPSSGRCSLFRFVRMNPVLTKLSLDDVMSDLFDLGIQQDGAISIEDVKTNFSYGNWSKANDLLCGFAERLNRRALNSCRVITDKTQKGAIVRIEFDPDVPRSVALAAMTEPCARLPKAYALCARYILASDGRISYREFLTFASDVCGIRHSVIFGCRMVKDGYLIKDKAEFQLKNAVVNRVTHVRLSDDFPTHLLNATEEPETVYEATRPTLNATLEYCTERFGYLVSDLPGQPVDQFKMWVREIIDGQAGASRVKIHSMYPGHRLWTPELTEAVTPATIELAHAVAHLLEQGVGNLVGDHVRLGAPENRTVLAHAMEYGFVPRLLAFPKEQRLSQSIAWLHLPNRAFRALFVQNGVRDIAALIRARENGTVLAGVGAGNLALVDEAIARLVTGNGDQSGRAVSPVRQTAGRIDALRIAG